MGCQGSKAAVPSNAPLDEESKTPPDAEGTKDVEKKDTPLLEGAASNTKKPEPENAKKDEKEESQPPKQLASEQNERISKTESQISKRESNQSKNVDSNQNKTGNNLAYAREITFERMLQARISSLGHHDNHGLHHYHENENNACNLNSNNFTANAEIQNLKMLSNNFSSTDFFCVNGNSDDEAGFRDEFITQCPMMYSKDKTCRNINNDDCMTSLTTGLHESVNGSTGGEKDGASLSLEGLPSEAHIGNLMDDAMNRQNDNRSCEMLPEEMTPAVEVKANASADIFYNTRTESRRSSVSTPEPASDEGKMTVPLSCINNGNEVVRSHISSRWNDPDDLMEIEKDDSVIMTRHLIQENLSAASTLVCNKGSKTRETVQDDRRDCKASASDDS